MKSVPAFSLLCPMVLAGLLPLAALFALPARAADNAGVGAFLSECSECHSVAPGKNKKGPSLFGVVGRASGSAPGYAYSDAMKNAHLTWNDDTLRAYLSQPAAKTVPGTKMRYDGLPDKAQLDAIIAYLSTLH